MMARKKTPQQFSLPAVETLLGGLTPKAFLRDYWQKKPLLVRQAIPGFGPLIDKTGLLELACREDAESRLVRRIGERWQLDYGPLQAGQLNRLPKRNWSVLVQGVNMLVTEADQLLRAFDFIPHARLDDLMVSFAPAGGGVGPHFDSYDVFLIQGLGQRRWEIGAQQDRTLVDGAPLRILKNFEPELTWDLEPGDMLYLPPQYAHNGVALTDCMTWSVGFRAYPAQEVAMQFLIYLQDNLDIPGLYADPDLQPAKHPGKIPAEMVKQFKTMLSSIQWTGKDMENFIGGYLSEPKPAIYFDAPARPPVLRRFIQSASQRGLRLDAKSRLLYRKKVFYMNGEHVEVTPTHIDTLRYFADRRNLAGGFECDETLWLLFYEWFCSGFLHIGAND